MNEILVMVEDANSGVMGNPECGCGGTGWRRYTIGDGEYMRVVRCSCAIDCKFIKRVHGEKCSMYEVRRSCGCFEEVKVPYGTGRCGLYRVVYRESRLVCLEHRVKLMAASHDIRRVIRKGSYIVGGFCNQLQIFNL